MSLRDWLMPDELDRLLELLEQTEAAEDAADEAHETHRLADDWIPGDCCPVDGQPCERMGCFDAGCCPQRTLAASDLGAAAGELIATAYERAAASPSAEERCASCAFRRGTRPNRTGDTMVLAAAALAGRYASFNCHEKGRAGTVCAGFAAVKRDA